MPSQQRQILTPSGSSECPEDVLSLAAKASLLVFDFDGTIADTESVHYLSYNELLGEDFDTSLCLKEFRGYVGLPRSEAFAAIKARHSIRFDDAEFNRKRIETFTRLLSGSRLSPFSYFTRLCADLPLTPAIIASAQDESLIMRALDLWSIRSRFDGVFAVEPPETKATLLQRVCTSSDTTPQEAVLFEDSPRNLQAGKELGMRTVGIRTTTNGSIPQASCDAVIDMRGECLHL